MSIFDSIRNAIFGQGAKTATAPPSTTTSPATPRSVNTAPTAPAAPPKTEPVDIEAVMKDYEARSGQKLNWRTSIVDLLKLLGIDSSLQNRKALSEELGFDGDNSDSAAMNVWLHKRVMQKLAESGGKVPASLRD
jgi:uncharacterized protein DUF3597